MEFASAGSNQKSLSKLLRDHDNGKLPPGFQFDAEAVRERLKAGPEFVPPPALSVTWSAFWEIRRTKDAQFPITHGDILNYMQALRMELDVWEVKTVLAFDSAYYTARDAHHKQG